jgi:hypothetical protein
MGDAAENLAQGRLVERVVVAVGPLMRHPGADRDAKEAKGVGGPRDLEVLEW